MDCFKEERANIDFDQRELSLLWYDGEETYTLHKQIAQEMANDPVLKIDHTFYDLPREQQLGINIKRAVRMEQLHKEGKIPKPGRMNIGILADHSGSVGALALHYGMFETVIQYLGSEEQMAEYLPKVSSLEYLGCYAQTEIGHGSDVSLLETTATFDQATDSFIVNSPTVTSAKFWPGELGKMCTHCVFHAQMIIGEKNYGIQSFI